MSDTLRDRAETLVTDIQSHVAHIEWEVWQARQEMAETDIMTKLHYTPESGIKELSDEQHETDMQTLRAAMRDVLGRTYTATDETDI